MNNEDLDRILSKLDARECAIALETLTEKERKQISGRALEWLSVSEYIDHPEVRNWSRFGLGLRLSDMPKSVQKLHSQQEEAKKLASQLPPEARQAKAIEPARAAVFATCTLTEIKKHNGQPTNAEICYDILKSRQPKWVSQWAAHQLKDCPEIYWSVIRRLERQKVVTLDADAEYLRAMAIGIAITGGIIEQLRDEELLARLDAMLADDSVSRLFIGERPSGRDAQNRYWNTLRHVPEKWAPALKQLAEDGSVPSFQLLQSTLAVFSRLALESSEGASKLNLKWYIALHDAISLPPEEEKRLAESYIRMLYSRHAATVGWSMNRLKRLIESQVEIPVEEFCAGLGAIFLVKGKDNAVKAIDCLSAVATEFPAHRGTVLRTALQALDSESQDIHKRALSLIEKHGSGDANVVDELRSSLDRIAIVHRQRAQEWLQKQGGSSQTGEQKTTASTSAPTAVPMSDSGASMDSQVPDMEELIERFNGLPESLRSTAGITTALEAIQSGCTDVPALDFDGTEFPRLNPEKRFNPIKDFDELVFFLTKVLHTFDLHNDGDTLERAIDGIARVGAVPPDDLDDRVRPFNITTPMFGSIGHAVKLWVIGPQPLNPSQWQVKAHPIDMIVHARLEAAATAARERKPKPILCTPTHEGGWIDPVVLVERTIQRMQSSRQSPPEKRFKDLKSITNAISSLANTIFGGSEATQTQPDAELYEECLAILRLAPENRQEALALLLSEKLPPSEFVSALRYALGDADASIGTNKALWVAAARARSPFTDDPDVESKFPGLGPDTGCAARYELLFNRLSAGGRLDWNSYKFVERLPKVAASSPKAIMTALHQQRETNFSGPPIVHQQWASMLCPMLLEGWFAHAANAMAREDSRYEVAQNKKFLEKLYDPDVPLKQIAGVTLIMAVCAAEKELQGAALEALIQVIDDGRINSEQLAGIVQRLRNFEKPPSKDQYGKQFVFLNRYAKALKTAALTSPYHAHVVARSIEHMLTGDPLSPPQHLHTLLEVMLELYVQQEQSITLDEARTYLSAIKISGKTEKLIKQLLALKPGPNTDAMRLQALGYALETRIARAQRWQSWTEKNRQMLQARSVAPVTS